MPRVRMTVSGRLQLKEIFVLLMRTIVVQGDVEYDKYAGELVVNARSIGTAQKVKVVDNAEKKRVELPYFSGAQA